MNGEAIGFRKKIKQGRELGMAGVVGGMVRDKCRQLYLNNNKITLKIRKYIKKEKESF